MLCFADQKYVGLVNALRMKYLFPKVTKYELPQLNAIWYEFKYSLCGKISNTIQEIIIAKKNCYVSKYMLKTLFITSKSKKCGFLYHLFENYMLDNLYYNCISLIFIFKLIIDAINHPQIMKGSTYVNDLYNAIIELEKSRNPRKEPTLCHLGSRTRNLREWFQSTKKPPYF